MCQKGDVPEIKKEGKKLPQYCCAVLACIGSLIIGNHLAWTSPGLQFLKNKNNSVPFLITDDSQEDWIAALLPLGAICGALPAGILADFLGRKLCLMLGAATWTGMSIFMTLAKEVTVLYGARFAAGIVMGLTCNVVPMYITEISEDSIRGTLGTLFQLFMTIGILSDYVLGYFNSYLILCNTITTISAIFLICLLFIEESPTYFMLRKRKDAAEQSLRKLRGKDYDTEAELNKLQAQLQNTTSQLFSWKYIFRKANAKALTISVGLMMLQQLTGVNGVIFFAQGIFTNAGVSSPNLCTVIFGSVQCLATGISSIFIDRVGRKMLLLLSALDMAFCLAALGFYFWTQQNHVITIDIYWLPLISLVCFIIGFSIGLGPIPWLIFSEVLSPEVKNFGAAATVVANCGFTALVSFFFLPLVKVLTAAYTFWIFATFCVITAVFTTLALPETKGKSLQQIQNELSR